LAQNSALRPVPLRVPELVLLQVPGRVLLPVPKPRLEPLSVSEPMPGSVSVSAYSREQQDRLYIPSH
jgi:hypothetical protein